MHWAEKTLVVLLRFWAVILLSALVPAFMPYGWMNAIHRELIHQELPDVPIVGYLTRSASALYAYHGALVLFLSFNVRRHLPVIKCLLVLSGTFGAGMLVLDPLVGLPWYWTLGEGLSVIVWAILLYWFAVQTERQASAAASGT